VILLRAPVVVLVIACAVLAPSRANAAYGCSVTVVGVSFGSYDPVVATPDDSAGRVDVTCSNVPGTGVDSVAYSVALSPGAAGSFTPRGLASGAARLDYNLFRDAGRTQVWGNGTSGSFLVSGSMRVGPGQGNTTRTNTHDIFGRVPAQQDAVVGAYADTIVVTLTF
jgi:spore coat protein U-like protein